MASRAEERIHRQIAAAAAAAATTAIAQVPDIVGAALEAVPVRDTPRGPAVISDAAALYLFLKHVSEAQDFAAALTAIENDASLSGWFEFMTPAPLGDGGG